MPCPKDRNIQDSFHQASQNSWYRWEDDLLALPFTEELLAVDIAKEGKKSFFLVGDTDDFMCSCGWSPSTHMHIYEQQ